MLQNTVERILRYMFKRRSAVKWRETGAGLAMVRQVAERHGGRAWATSSEGGGAEFYITAIWREKPPRGEKGGSMTLRPFNIVIAEDNEDDILLIREAFEEVNMVNRIAVVRDGEEAFGLFAWRGPFQRVLLPAWYCSTSICEKDRPRSTRRSRPETSVFAPLPIVMLTVSRATNKRRRTSSGPLNKARAPTFVNQSPSRDLSRSSESFRNVLVLGVKNSLCQEVTRACVADRG